MRAIVTCVQYDDFLSLTLERILSHFCSVLVVTELEDELTRSAVRKQRACLNGQADKLICYPTAAFHANEARFNKGAALDEVIGFLRELGDDWTCVLDADIYLPETMDLSGIERGHLYSPHRRMMTDPGPIPPESEWDALPGGPEHRNNEFAGYFHLFHTGDIGSPSWYENPFWDTAQGCDTVFTHNRWGRDRLRRLPFEVLHLGPNRVNWEGRVSERWHDEG